jgi:hypothetical protein
MTKNYGYLNAKTLAKLAKNPALYRVPVEYSDPDGWYADGQNDAKRGAKRSYGSCSIPENQTAYLAGYDSVLDK